MELNQAFIKLPFTFDVAQLQKEVTALPSSAWMAHPSRLNGNSAVPLVSVNGEDNDEFSGHMQPTPHLQQCEYIGQCMAHFDEVIARSRLMRLAGGTEVNSHIDFNYHWYSRVRIHIPIVTYPEVTFYCGDEQRHMAEGECWIFDSWRRHRVTNDHSNDRVHLVIDTAGSSRFWKMVRDLENGIEIEGRHIAHEPGKNVELKTERYTVPVVMAPGEMEAMINELIAAFSSNPDNDTDLVNHYQNILIDLAKDWRQTWSQYGEEEAGKSVYQALLQRTMKSLHPKPRALVIKSNDVGVNPVIVQRILRSAMV